MTKYYSRRRRQRRQVAGEKSIASRKIAFKVLIILPFCLFWIFHIQPPSSSCCVAAFFFAAANLPHQQRQQQQHPHHFLQSNHHRYNTQNNINNNNDRIKRMRSSSRITTTIRQRRILPVNYYSTVRGAIGSTSTSHRSYLLLTNHRHPTSHIRPSSSTTSIFSPLKRELPIQLQFSGGHSDHHRPPLPNAASLPSSSSSSSSSSTRLYASSSSSASSTVVGIPPEEPTPSPTINNSKDEEEEYSPYEKWVRRLYMTNMFHPVKMGLANMQTLHKVLGYPMDNDSNVAVIHVAGTNGKGSVALKIATTLQQYGLRVGLFCSPHVSSFRERMQINGELISEEDVIELLPEIYNLCEEHEIPATFFEITTALAFSFYAKHKAQVVVLETGLGGRLDATNVIAKPALSIITSIGLEHTRILGDTVELIALEKGGIIKPNCPVLVGPHCPQDVLRQCALEKGSGPYYNPKDVLKGGAELTEDYDQENQQIAKAALVLLQSSHPHLIDPKSPLTEEAMERGTLARPPCRFEQVKEDGLTVVLDVAHNPPAMAYLVRKLEATFPDSKFRFVLGMSSDKDLGQCGRSILAITKPSAIHLIEAAHPRAAKLEAIRDADPQLLGCHCDLEDRSITKQIVTAKTFAKKNGEILVVCGSVFVMAEAREALGFEEPRDSEYVSEVAGSGLRHGQEQFGNTKGM